MHAASKHRPSLSPTIAAKHNCCHVLLHSVAHMPVYHQIPTCLTTSGQSSASSASQCHCVESVQQYHNTLNQRHTTLGMLSFLASWCHNLEQNHTIPLTNITYGRADLCRCQTWWRLGRLPTALSPKCTYSLHQSCWPETPLHAASQNPLAAHGQRSPAPYEHQLWHVGRAMTSTCCLGTHCWQHFMPE